MDEFWRLIWGDCHSVWLGSRYYTKPCLFSLIVYWFRVDWSIDKGERGSLSSQSVCTCAGCVWARVRVLCIHTYREEAGQRKGAWRREKRVKGVHPLYCQEDCFVCVVHVCNHVFGCGGWRLCTASLFTDRWTLSCCVLLVLTQYCLRKWMLTSCLCLYHL